ncbi:MAG TPA: hypothetical protein VIH86_13860 [Puia sp.]
MNPEITTNITVDTVQENFEFNLFIFLKHFAGVSGLDADLFTSILNLITKNNRNSFTIDGAYKKRLCHNYNLTEEALIKTLRRLWSKGVIKRTDDFTVKINGEYEISKSLTLFLPMHNVTFKIIKES